MAEKRKKQEEASRQELLLDRPRLQLPHVNLYFEIGFYTLLVLLGGFGALCCVQTAFGLPVYARPLVLVGCACGLLGVVQALLPKGRLVLTGAMALLWGVALVALWEDAVEGACRVLNLVLQAYSERLSFPLRQFDVPPAGRGRVGITCTAFAGVCLPPFFWLLSWTLVKRKDSLGAFCLTCLTLCTSMALSIVPDFWALCMLLLFWCMLLLCTTVLGQRHRLLEERRGFLVSGAALRPVVLALLPLIALCMLLVYRAFPEEEYQRPQQVNDLRAGLTNGFGLDAMLEGGQGSNNNTINLERLGSREYTGKAMLRARFDWPEDISISSLPLQKDYLKSFTGAVYTGRAWERLSQGDAQALEGFARPGDIQNLPAQFAALLPCYLDDGQRYTVSIENKAANPRCVYAPYGLAAWEEDLSPLGLEYVQDGFLESKNFFSGTRGYSFNAVTLPEDGVFLVDRVYTHWAQKLADGDGEYTESYLDGIAAALEQAPPEEWALSADQLLVSLMGDPLLPEKDFRTPAWAKEPLSQGGKRLVDVAESYRGFVDEVYLQLPDGLEGFLDGFRQEHGLLSPYKGEVDGYTWSQQEFLEKLAQLFQEGYTYTLDPPPTPSGQDFAAYFLGESKTGFCVHFATAAVALCRSAGIPARYAEGYVAPTGPTGIWVDVPDYNAHAWLEVYISGTGWAPVEVTPQNEDAPASYPNAQAPAYMAAPGEGPDDAASSPEETDAAPTLAPTATPSAMPSPSPSPSPSGGGAAGSGTAGEEGSLLPLLIGVSGVLALAPAGLWANRKLRLYLRRRAFSQEDRSKAALEVYAHLLKLHKLQASLYYGDRQPPPHWEELALKARFGRDMLPLEDLQALAADAAQLEASLKEELPSDRRFACQYLRGLF